MTDWWIRTAVLVIAACGAVLTVVLARISFRSRSVTRAEFEELEDRVSGVRDSVTENRAAIERWGKKLDMRQRRAAGDDVETVPTGESLGVSGANRKAALRAVMARRVRSDVS